MNDVVKLVHIDAAGWVTVLDFYGALLQAVGAPDWHGRNPNALVETMIWSDEINKLRPPYVIRISGTRDIPREVKDHINLAKGDLERARSHHRQMRGRDVDVRIEADIQGMNCPCLKAGHSDSLRLKGWCVAVRRTLAFRSPVNSYKQPVRQNMEGLIETLRARSAELHRSLKAMRSGAFRTRFDGSDCNRDTTDASIRETESHIRELSALIAKAVLL